MLGDLPGMLHLVAMVDGFDVVEYPAAEVLDHLHHRIRPLAAIGTEDRRTKNTAFELILVYDVSWWGGSRTPMRAFTTSIAASRQGYMSSSMPSS